MEFFDFLKKVTISPEQLESGSFCYLKTQNTNNYNNFISFNELSKPTKFYTNTGEVLNNTNQNKEIYLKDGDNFYLVDSEKLLNFQEQIPKAIEESGLSKYKLTIGITTDEKFPSSTSKSTVILNYAEHTSVSGNNPLFTLGHELRHIAHNIDPVFKAKLDERIKLQEQYDNYTGLDEEYKFSLYKDIKKISRSLELDCDKNGIKIAGLKPALDLFNDNIKQSSKNIANSLIENNISWNEQQNEKLKKLPKDERNERKNELKAGEQRKEEFIKEYGEDMSQYGLNIFSRILAANRTHSNILIDIFTKGDEVKTLNDHPSPAERKEHAKNYYYNVLNNNNSPNNGKPTREK